MTGLHAIDRWVPPEQVIAIRLLDVVEGEFLDGIPAVVLGEFGNDRPGQCREIASRGQVTVTRQTRRIHKVARVHTESLCMLVHQFGKHRLGAREVLCEGNARIVSGLYDHTEQQIPDRDLFPDLDKHAGTRRPPGFLADRNEVVERNLTFPQGDECGIRRHQFGQAGWLELIVRLEGCQFTSGHPVDNKVAFGADNRRRGDRRDICMNRDGYGQQQNRHEQVQVHKGPAGHRRGPVL